MKAPADTAGSSVDKKGKQPKKKNNFREETIPLQQEQVDYFKKSETQNREFLAGIEKQRQKFVEDMERRQKEG